VAAYPPPVGGGLPHPTATAPPSAVQVIAFRAVPGVENAALVVVLACALALALLLMVIDRGDRR
jgi:hypothetical protein